MLYSSNISYGLKTLESKSALIILPILLAGIRWDMQLKNNVLKLFVFVVLLATLYSLVTTFIRFDIDFSDMRALVGVGILVLVTLFPQGLGGALARLTRRGATR
jgi:hypothetical protein